MHDSRDSFRARIWADIIAAIKRTRLRRGQRAHCGHGRGQRKSPLKPWRSRRRVVIRVNTYSQGRIGLLARLRHLSMWNARAHAETDGLKSAER